MYLELQSVYHDPKTKTVPIWPLLQMHGNCINNMPQKVGEEKAEGSRTRVECASVGQGLQLAEAQSRKSPKRKDQRIQLKLQAVAHARQNLNCHVLKRQQAEGRVCH